jgi:hypothetical protein
VARNFSGSQQENKKGVKNRKTTRPMETAWKTLRVSHSSHRPDGGYIPYEDRFSVQRMGSTPGRRREKRAKGKGPIETDEEEGKENQKPGKTKRNE